MDSIYSWIHFEPCDLELGGIVYLTSASLPRKGIISTLAPVVTSQWKKCAVVLMGYIDKPQCIPAFASASSEALEELTPRTKGSEQSARIPGFGRRS